MENVLHRRWSKPPKKKDVIDKKELNIEEAEGLPKMRGDTKLKNLGRQS